MQNQYNIHFKNEEFDEDAVHLRRKHEPVNKMSPEIRESVRKRILSFLRFELHYCRAISAKRYLQSDLNVGKMYRLYTQQAIDDNVNIASEHLYRQEFKQFNELSYSKKDCCVKCFKFNHVPLTEISELKEEFQEYIVKTNTARQDKANDKVKAAADKFVYCVEFDLQTVLDTALAEAGQRCKAFIWDEMEGHRGANDISSCMLNYLRSQPSTVTEVIMYSKILYWVRTKTWT